MLSHFHGFARIPTSAPCLLLLLTAPETRHCSVLGSLAHLLIHSLCAEDCPLIPFPLLANSM